MAELSADSRQISPSERAVLIRERLYAGLASMSVMVVLAADPERARAGPVATAVTMSVVALAAAGLFADLSAHTAAYGRLARGAELRHLLAVSLQALSAGLIPLLLIGLSALKVVTVRHALEGGIVSEVLFLGIVSWVATRHTEIRTVLRFLYVGAEMLIGLIVLGIKVVALH